MANHSTDVHGESAPPLSTSGRRWANPTAAWVLLVVLLALVVVGLWFWNSRPAHVQAAISAARQTTQQSDVMTVEAVSEAGRSVVGRHISIVNARVSHVAGLYLLASEVRRAR